MKNKLICRFAMNTSFIVDNKYEFSKYTVDPDSIIKDDRISPFFKIECFFKDFCQDCFPSMSIDELCEKCKFYLGEELEGWQIIKDILDNHPKPNYEEGVFTNFVSS